MNVITSFHEKYRLKQMEFERYVLQDISFSEIEQVVRHHFASFLKIFSHGRTPIEEVCIDYAVESYLLGASYGRFGYYGETRDQVHIRCQHDIKTLSDHLFDYWSFWGDSDESFLEAVYDASVGYITDWWERGFINGEKRYRLRMH